MMKLYFAACVLFIGACSSGPVPIEYYLLSSPASQQSSVAVPCKVHYSMVIESVELASFLRQSGLVYQTARVILLGTNAMINAKTCVLKLHTYTRSQSGHL